MKYAPARANGDKPYVAAVSSWGRRTEHIVWADTAYNAKYRAIGRQRYTSATVRRATPEDMVALAAAGTEENQP